MIYYLWKPNQEPVRVKDLQSSSEMLRKKLDNTSTHLKRNPAYTDPSLHTSGNAELFWPL